MHHHPTVQTRLIRECARARGRQVGMVRRGPDGTATITTADDAKALLADADNRARELLTILDEWQPSRVPTFWEWVRSGFRGF